MISHNVYDRCKCPPGVVQVGQPIAQSWPQMQQRGCGPPAHASVPVGGPRGDALKETEHAPHLRDFVKGTHRVNFGSTWIGKANGHVVVDQCLQHAVSAVQITSSS